MKRKLLPLILVLALLLTALSGCASKDESSAQSSPAQSQQTSVSDEQSSDPDTGVETDSAEPQEEPYFPLKESKTLSYWAALPFEASAIITNLEDTPGYRYLSERLNVDFDFVSVSAMVSSEQFNLMIASGEYCDILSSITGYSGGVSKAYDDGVIIELKDGIDKYCENYSTLLDRLDVRPDVQTDDGKYLVFYNLYEDYNVLTGVTVRQDLLDKLGMDAPVTYDDYEAFGLAVKTEFGISDPILLSSDCNTWAKGYNTSGFAADSSSSAATTLYQVDGEIRSAFTDGSYLEYLKLMNSWYNKGIINSDFFSRDTNSKSSSVEALILTGEVGLYENDANTIVNHESQAATDGYLLSGIGWPRMTVDSVNHIGSTISQVSLVQSNGAVSISTQCDDLELAFEFLDFMYTDEAMMLAAYGYPELYDLDDDGHVVFTDEAEALFVSNEYGEMTRNTGKTLFSAGIAGKRTQDDMYLNWGWDSKEVAAVELWNSEYYDEAWMLPMNISLTTEEAESISDISSTIGTYAAERIVGFITGDTPFEKFDDMVTEIENMGLAEVIAAYQSAMNRYLDR